MTNFIFPLLTFLGIFFEAFVFRTPFVLVLFVLYTVLTRSNSAFIFAFIAGILLDMLRVGDVGLTSMFFLITIFFVELYERKFEVQTFQFIFFATVLASFSYCVLFGYQVVAFQVMLTALLAVILFFGYTAITKR